MENEDEKLRAVALENARSIALARQRAERALLTANEALKRRTRELADSLAELREQRERFRVTLASIGDAVITTDTAGLVTFLNPVAEHLTGWTHAEAAGRPLAEVLRIVNELTRQAAPSPIDVVLREGTAVDLANHTALIRRDGTQTAIEDSAAPIRDADGRITGAVLVFHDVTARRRAEMELRSTAERLQLALDAGHLGDWSWDARTDRVLLGPRAVEIFGISDAQTTWADMRRMIVGEDADRARLGVEQALASRADYDIEYMIERPSGEHCWIAARGRVVYDESGAPVGMIGVVQDISARKRAEEMRAHLAAVVESSDDAIISKTLDGVITSWNAGARRMFGYTAGEAIGQPIAILIPPDRVEEERVILERMRGGERIEHYETVRKRKDGALIDVSLTVSPVEDHAGRTVGVSKIARDITRQKLAEAALLENDRRKDEFLATLAHELRNPLAPIRQAALISKAPGATEAQKRWSHEVIDRQVQHMSLLLDDLLDVSRITRGTLELRKKPIELASVIDAAVETARPLIDAKRHTLSMDLPSDVVYLSADPLRLAQVLSNLLTNAAKYTDPEGEIRLRAYHEPNMIVLSVSDNGIGIAPESLRNIFQMFSQVHAAADRGDSGLGIGLALARGLVDLHGGTIEARSAGLGHGSEFIVRLPLGIGGPVQSGAGSDSAAGTPDMGRRILVADDNRDAAESLAMLLRMDGHEVAIAHDGPAALATFSAFEPDLALLDIGMPGLSGYEVAEKIRKRPGGAAVTLVALTGWGQYRDRERAIEAGFDHHFTKPWDPRQLTEILRLERPG